jgi:hypothetical protein
MVFLTLFQIHVAIIVKVVSAHGAVEVVLGVHLVGGVGDGRGREIGVQCFGSLSLLRWPF